MHYAIRIILALAAVGGVGFGVSHCARPDSQRKLELLFDGNKKELRQIENTWLNSPLHPSSRMSSLDSVAYRGVLNDTSAANDPAVIADFEKVAAETKITKEAAKDFRLIGDAYDYLDQKMFDMGVSRAEHQKNLKYYNSPRFFAPSGRQIGTSRKEGLTLAARQHKVDSIAYRQFFEKHNLLDPETLKKFEETADYTRP